jgi:hypothetical protein
MPVCPVCHNSVDEVINQPQPITMPSIAPAFDLASAIAAINQLIMGYNNMRGPQGAAGNNGAGGKAGKSPPTTPGGKYIENRQRRVVNKIVIHSKEDPDTTITFNRIDKLNFVDSKTKEPWDWSR